MTPAQLKRFMAKVIEEPNCGCWLWNGALRTKGYGAFFMGPMRHGPGSCALAHRVSYEHFVGPIPDGMCACHRCDVPACVNPAHLFVGTYAENNIDAYRKGRNPWTPARKQAAQRNRLTRQAVSEIRRMRAEGASTYELATVFGVTPTTIGNATNGRTFRSKAGE